MQHALGSIVLLVLAACPAPRPSGRPPPDAAGRDTAPPPSANTAPPLAGTDWTLVALGGRPVAAVEPQERPGLRLQADGLRVQGSAGCNRMAGPYKAEGGSLEFGPLATTHMACPALDIEQGFLKALAATTRYEIAGSNLTLYAGDVPVARLEALGAPSH